MCQKVGEKLTTKHQHFEPFFNRMIIHIKSKTEEHIWAVYIYETKQMNPLKHYFYFKYILNQTIEYTYTCSFIKIPISRTLQHM